MWDMSRIEDDTCDDKGTCIYTVSTSFLFLAKT